MTGLLIFLIALLVPAVAAAETVLVPRGAAWRYLDNGSNQGTAWRGVGFDDASWAPGPAQLGYGDGGEATTVVASAPTPRNKFITTYFRRSFNVADRVAAFASLTLAPRCATTARSSTSTASRSSRSNMPGGTVELHHAGRDRDRRRGRDRRSVDDRAVAGRPGRGHQRPRGRGAPVGSPPARTSASTSSWSRATPRSASRAAPICSSAHPTDVVVRWRTDAADRQPRPSTVRPSPTLDVEVYDADASTTEHEVRLERPRSRHALLLRGRARAPEILAGGDPHALLRHRSAGRGRGSRRASG